MSKTKLAILYGGITTEHEVSVITAVQLMKHADPKKYDLIPIYIDKSGQWWTGNQLLNIGFYNSLDLFKPQGLTAFALSPQKNKNQIEAAILCFHGDYGESGKIQGLLELAGIPYQGPNVTGSSAAFDKIITRQILTAENISQAKYIWFNAADWQENQDQVLTKVKTLKLPVFIKPSRSGSSIGISRVSDGKKLKKAIEEVMQFDSRILVEEEVVDCIEVNVSVLGGKKIEASVTEQPLKSEEFLSFADKYEKGGGKKSGMASATRRIPAPISSSLSDKLRELAKKIFRIFDCSGVVRIDFFANPSTEEVFVTELNTIPGSMSFYLWEATDLKYPQLIDRLVEVAFEQHKQKEKLITSFETNILEKAK